LVWDSLWKTTVALIAQGHCRRTLQGISLFVLQVTISNEISEVIKSDFLITKSNF
jgi:hypothetical protein